MAAGSSIPKRGKVSITTVEGETIVNEVEISEMIVVPGEVIEENPIFIPKVHVFENTAAVETKDGSEIKIDAVNNIIEVDGEIVFKKENIVDLVDGGCHLPYGHQPTDTNGGSSTSAGENSGPTYGGTSTSGGTSTYGTKVTTTTKPTYGRR